MYMMDIDVQIKSSIRRGWFLETACNPVVMLWWYVRKRCIDSARSPSARAFDMVRKDGRIGMKTISHTYITLLCVCTFVSGAVLEKAISNILQPAGLLTHYLHNIIAKAQFSDVERNSEIKIPAAPVNVCIG